MRGNKQWEASPPPLAILGADPAFREKVHVGRPNIGNRQRFLERVNAILDSRYLTNAGPFEVELERRISEMLDVRHCVLMCNATAALELAMRGLGLADEVIVPSFTFVATVHALKWQGLTPVFCDVDPRTHNLDPSKVEELITPRTSGILAVHLWGRPCDVEGLQAIAERHGLKLLFDSAHAFGCSYKGRKIGGFGQAEILSFHATKFIGTGEGGAVLTNDDGLARRLRLMRNFGFSGYDQTSGVGTNAKLSELSAALGLTNLESMEAFIETNRRNCAAYASDLPAGLSLLRYHDSDTPNYQYLVTEVNAEEIGLTRDELLTVLHAENILARRYFYPGVHRMEPYRSLYPDVGVRLAATEAVAERVMVLPTGTGVTVADIGKICAVIRCAAEHPREIQAALRRPSR